MALFEDEKVDEGITLRVYRFESHKPVMSIVVRMMGKQTQDASDVIAPMRKQLKEERKAALKAFEAKHKPTWLRKLTDKEKEEHARLLLSANGDCFFDINRFEGEIMLAQIIQALKSKGLEAQPTQRRSNAELDEEIHHFT